MTNDIGQLGTKLYLPKDKEQELIPGMFVGYDATSKKSSKIEITASTGFIKKTKNRSFEKAIYEFLVLKVWNQLFKEYSNVNDLQFRAPKPIYLTGADNNWDINSNKLEPNQKTYSLVMEFINGYELTGLNKLKRGTPVKLRNYKTPVPLYPACAFHIGALNRIKELESLYHSDYASRHIIFSPVENVSISVIDVENSRKEMPDLVKKESNNLFIEFDKLTSSDNDKRALESWYDQGYQSVIKPNQELQLERIIDELNKKYKIKLDIWNGYINDTKINLR